MSMVNRVKIYLFILMLGAFAANAFAANVSDEAMRHWNRGLAAVEMAKSQADYEAAIAEFRQAAQLAPDWPDVWYNLGLVQDKAAKFEDALNSLKRYLQLTPDAGEASQVKQLMDKIEYKRERSNIEGIWKVDKNEMSVTCDPGGYAIKKGAILSSIFTIEDIQLEVRKNQGKLEARVLSSKRRLGSWLPDGPFVPVQQELDSIKIFDAPMSTCNSEIQSDHCPWKARFILKQTATNALEGTIEAGGLGKKVVDYRTFRTEPYGYSCEGRIVLRREENIN